MTDLVAPTQIGARAEALFATRSTAFDVPGSTVRPMALRSFRPNDHTIKDGFPYLPQMWINADTLVSSDGTYLAGDQDDPFDVDIEMHTRFIASDSTYDSGTFEWQPAMTNGINYFFDGGASGSPIIDDITYRVGKKVFDMQALNFSPGQYLASSFNDGADDAIQFSISMAVILEPADDSYGILATPNDGPRFEITTDGVNLTFTVNGVTGVSKEKVPVAQQVPFFLCLSVNAGSVTLYTANSSQSIRSASINTEAVSTQMEFLLGMDWFGNANSRMYVLEWGLWDYAVNKSSDTTIYELLSAYSSIYGA